MKVKELKKLIANADDELLVVFRVNTEYGADGNQIVDDCFVEDDWFVVDLV